MITEEKGKVYLGFTFNIYYLNIPATAYFTYSTIEEIKKYQNIIISKIPSITNSKIISKILGFNIPYNSIDIPFLFKGDILFIFDFEYTDDLMKLYKKFKNIKYEVNDNDIKNLKYNIFKVYIL